MKNNQNHTRARKTLSELVAEYEGKAAARRERAARCASAGDPVGARVNTSLAERYARSARGYAAAMARV